MSLLNDIQAERKEVTKEVRSLARLILLEMCDTVKRDHGCRPVVAAIVGNQAELHFPTWNTPAQKTAALATISDGLKERNVSAAVCAFSGIMDSDHGPQRAVIVTIQTLDWKAMMIQPYRVKDNKVQWSAPYSTDLKSPLIEISCAN